MWELASQIAKQGVGNLFFHKGKVHFCVWSTVAWESISKVMFFSCIAELYLICLSKPLLLGVWWRIACVSTSIDSKKAWQTIRNEEKYWNKQDSLNWDPWPRNFLDFIHIQGPRIHGVQGGRGPPDFENPKKLSHKNAIKLDFSEKWGQNWAFGPPWLLELARPLNSFTSTWTLLLFK